MCRVGQTVHGISIYSIYAVYDRIYAVYAPYMRRISVFTVYEGKWIHSKLIHSGVILQLLKS
jgi:hypothetical protein